MELFDYWEDHPPLYILLQGIASGLAGTPIGRQSRAKIEPSKHIQSAEELFGIMSSAGLSVGVIYGKR